MQAVASVRGEIALQDRPFSLTAAADGQHPEPLVGLDAGDHMGMLVPPPLSDIDPQLHSRGSGSGGVPGSFGTGPDINRFLVARLQVLPPAQAPWLRRHAPNSHPIVQISLRACMNCACWQW